MTAQKTNSLIIASISNIDLDPIFSEDLRKQVEQVGKAATKIPAKLSDASEVAIAEEVIKTAKGLAKQFEAIRKTFSGPLDEKKKQLIELERTVLKPASAAADVLTKSVNSYHNEQASIAREAQAKLQEEADKKLRRMSNPTNIAALQQATEEAVVSVAAPTTGTKKVKKYRVVDISLVPRELLTVDDEKIKNLIKQGATTCAGLEIYEEVIRSGR